MKTDSLKVRHGHRLSFSLEQGTRGLINVFSELMLPHNLISIFLVENVSPRKTENVEYHPTPFNRFSRFSSSFHQNDDTVSGHLIFVTDDSENIVQCKISKILIFEARISI